jgi:hypothetical protein
MPRSSESTRRNVFDVVAPAPAPALAGGEESGDPGHSIFDRSAAGDSPGRAGYGRPQSRTSVQGPSRSATAWWSLGALVLGGAAVLAVAFGVRGNSDPTADGHGGRAVAPMPERAASPPPARSAAAPATERSEATERGARPPKRRGRGRKHRHTQAVARPRAATPAPPVAPPPAASNPAAAPSVAPAPPSVPRAAPPPAPSVPVSPPRPDRPAPAPVPEGAPPEFL